MKKSGLADSPLFKTSPEIKTNTSPSMDSPKKKKSSVDQKSTNRRKPVTSRHHDINPSINHDVNQPINNDTMKSRYHDSTIEAIRGELKGFGKEATTIRFTQKEKKGIEDLVYTFKRRNIKTNINEITRISVNYILQDHKEKGKQSLLDMVIQALNQ